MERVELNYSLTNIYTMEISQPSNSHMAGLYLLALNAFCIPYTMRVSAGKDNDSIIFSIADDIPPRLMLDFGICLGLMRKEIQQVFVENIWPIPNAVI